MCIRDSFSGLDVFLRRFEGLAQRQQLRFGGVLRRQQALFCPVSFGQGARVFVGDGLGGLPGALGALAGGIAAGFPVGMVLRNLIPIIIFAAIIALGLFKFRDATIKAFSWFGKFVIIVITIGLAAAIVEALTGWVIIPGMAPISERCV